MRIIITEEQYRGLMIEQKVGQVKITGGNHSLIPEYCEVLRLSKSDGDNIIGNNRGIYGKIIDEQFEYLKSKIMDIRTGYKKDGSMINKFKPIIDSITVDIKKDIIIEMNKYYNQLVYSSIGLNKMIDMNPIVSNISNIIFNGIMKQYESSFMVKNLGKMGIGKDNIEKSKEIARKIVKEFEEIVIYFVKQVFEDFVDLDVIYKYKKEKEKTSPICDKVLIVQDKNYKNVTPYSPRQTYKDFEYMNYNTLKVDIVSTILPKINSVLDSLV
jgi:hypothetical protein